MPNLAQPQPTGIAKAEIFERAEAFAARNNFLPGDRIEPVVSRIGGVIRYLDRRASDEVAEDGSLIVRGREDFEIFLSAHTGVERDRFTIAHELGHYVLHSQQGEVPLVATRFGSTRVEWEANWFAAAFLMPQGDYRAAFERYGGQIPALASRYLVSLRAAQVRAVALGLVSG